jgi:hypothetical protein
MSRRPDPHDVVRQFRQQQKRAARGKSFGMGTPTARATERSTPLREIPLSDGLRAIQAAGGLEADARAFTFGECSVLLGRGPDGWHLSIAHRSRYPTWDEIAEARYRLVPDDATMAMILPSQAHYVNLYPNCFHLYEIETRGGPSLPAAPSGNGGLA